MFGVAGLLGVQLEAQTLTRGPYLQAGSHTNVTIRWRSEGPTDSLVRYGTALAGLCFTNADASSVTDHIATLTGLMPGTKYFYTIGSAAGELAGPDADHFFVTAPVPGSVKNTRVWVLGDAGTTLPGQIAVRDAYENFTGARHTDLWLMLGDNAYNSGLDFEYQAAVFNVYSNLLAKAVLWPALGNHDTAQAAEFVDTYPYFDIFTLPKNGEAGGVASGTEHYYSFNYANIHFICLDSMTGGRYTNSPMYQWLTNDLANVTSDWLIAYWHHPPYSKGTHDSDYEGELIAMREVFLPVLEQGGVDLVLSGHSHTYERSYLLDGHYATSSTLTAEQKLDAGRGRENESGPYRKHLLNPVAHQGAVYVVAGTSGWAGSAALNHPAMCVSGSLLGSLVLDINGNRLDATFLRDTGETNDTFTIIKTPDLAPFRLHGPTFDSQGRRTVSWSSVGGQRYRLSYRDGDLSGPFTDLVRAVELELNAAPPRTATTQSFRDDDTLTGGAPGGGIRYYRVRTVP